MRVFGFLVYFVVVVVNCSKLQEGCIYCLWALCGQIFFIRHDVYILRVVSNTKVDVVVVNQSPL